MELATVTVGPGMMNKFYRGVWVIDKSLGTMVKIDLTNKQIALKTLKSFKRHTEDMLEGLKQMAKSRFSKSGDIEGMVEILDEMIRTFRGGGEMYIPMVEACVMTRNRAREIIKAVEDGS